MKFPLLLPSRSLPNLITLIASASMIGMALLAQPAAMGDVIFNWGGKYVSNYTEIDGGTPTVSGGASTWLYSNTTKKSPDYAGPAFYGAFSLIYGSGTGTPEFRTDLFGIAPGSGSNNDQIRFSANAPADTNVTMRGLLFFNKADFLGAASTELVTFDSTSSLTLKLSTSIGATSRSIKMAVYALVGGEWGWYLSSASTASASTPFTIADPAAAKWAPYSISDTTTPLNGLPLLAAYTVPGSSFEDIGAVGVFFNYVQPSGGNASVYLESFQVNANIPEPSVAPLAMGGLVFAFGIRAMKGKW